MAPSVVDHTNKNTQPTDPRGEGNVHNNYKEEKEQVTSNTKREEIVIEKAPIQPKTILGRVNYASKELIKYFTFINSKKVKKRI